MVDANIILKTKYHFANISVELLCNLSNFIAFQETDKVAGDLGPVQTPSFS